MNIRNSKLIKVMEKISERGNCFKIPVYQREYQWKEEQCLILIHDLFDFSKEYINLKNKFDKENPLAYFLGTIIVREKINREYLIVDGQQRLTTIFIFISVIRHFLLDYQQKNKFLNSDEQKILDDSISTLYLDFENADDPFLSRMDFSEGNYIFSEMIKDDFDPSSKKIEKSMESNILKNYIYINKLIKNNYSDYSFDSSIDFVKEIYYQLSKARVLWLQISEFDDENLIFENINYKGVRLYPSDLIKNLIFSNEDKKTNLENEKYKRLNFLSKKYKEIIMEIPAKNEEKRSKMSDSLFRYFVSYYGNFNLVKEGSMEIYYEFKKIFKKDLWTLEKTEQLIKKISKFFKAYKLIDDVKKNKDKNNYIFSPYLRSLISQSKDSYWLVIYSIIEKLDLIKEKEFSNSRFKNDSFEYKFDFSNKEKNKLFKDLIRLFDGFDMYSYLIKGDNRNITRGINGFAKNIKNTSSDENFYFKIKIQLVNGKEDWNKTNVSELYSGIKTTQIYKRNKKAAKRILINYENKFIEDLNSKYNLTEASEDKTIEHIIPNSILNLNDNGKYITDKGNIDLSSTAEKIHKEIKEWKKFFESKGTKISEVHEVINTLPNLVFLGKFSNSKLGNKYYLEKKNYVNDKTLALSYKEIFNKFEEEFSLKEVEKRINDFVEFFKNEYDIFID